MEKVKEWALAFLISLFSTSYLLSYLYNDPRVTNYYRETIYGTKKISADTKQARKNLLKTAVKHPTVYQNPGVTSPRIACDIPYASQIEVLDTQGIWSRIIWMDKSTKKREGWIPSNQIMSHDKGPYSDNRESDDADTNLLFLQNNTHLEIEGDKYNILTQEVPTLTEPIFLAAKYRDTRAIEPIESIYSFNLRQISEFCGSPSPAQLLIADAAADALADLGSLKSMQTLSMGIRAYIYYDYRHSKLPGLNGMRFCVNTPRTRAAHSSIQAMLKLIEKNGTDYEGIGKDSAYYIINNKNMYESETIQIASKVLTRLVQETPF